MTLNITNRNTHTIKARKTVQAHISFAVVCSLAISHDIKHHCHNRPSATNHNHSCRRRVAAVTTNTPAPRIITTLRHCLNITHNDQCTLFIFVAATAVARSLKCVNWSAMRTPRRGPKSIRSQMRPAGICELLAACCLLKQKPTPTYV